MKILIVGPSWVGDMVMAQSLFIALHHRYPDVAIDVIAPAWSRPLLERMPEVRRAIDAPFAHGELKLRQRYRMGLRLREEGYDQAIVLPNSLKSALIPLFAKVPLRTGWRGEMRYGVLNDCRTLDKERFPLMVQRFVALGLEPESMEVEVISPRLTVDQTIATSTARQLTAAFRPAEQTGQQTGQKDETKILAVCPGAEFGEAKQWPARHFATLINDVINRGWQAWIIGSAKDSEVARAIQQRLSAEVKQGCVDLTGKTSLGEAIDLLSQATAVVSNDSGLMHVAAAVDRPLVAVYGSTSPGFTPPLSGAKALLSLDLACQPCFKRSCPLGHLRCLNDLAVDTVRSGLNQVIASSAEADGTGGASTSTRRDGRL